MIALGLVIGLIKIHSMGVLHRDIKPNNILIDPKTQMVTYIDFGGSCTVNDRDKFLEHVGASAYIDPRYLGNIMENDRKETISTPVTAERLKAVDVWALGCVLFYVYTGKPIDMVLFPENEANINDKIIELTQDKIDKTLKNHIKDESSKFVAELIWPMLRIDWQERITLESTLDRLYIMANFLIDKDIPTTEKLDEIIKKSKARALVHVDKNTKKF